MFLWIFWVLTISRVYNCPIINLKRFVFIQRNIKTISVS